ncbi:Dihydrolipoamide dehydrogenase of pyruvate dehydrogenase complex (EC 1.8.1.4) [uncultured Gammaproteobacteria bacterium]|uniref:dihydrolipoyl dehydrogenase n=1 Tax=Bathymodiolus heckerae thiotrophic gill symbiont TaxID=1052212 RepID=UPI0010B15CCA|nr:dihydrolipoyl dehydrogenase [Bathymodiolus heckerae thiotrophic gill symbiont]CAC9435204.1 Dihydrolipoamide dehydrogenase of pyruvate dehydrogenase complex (EC 1.8.1.4) [uncultured Gammaproteobacteria bacterium]SMN14028.1 Dihydrolipoamide dehydrogenase of pyruvate dehydrogenase complex [Bathymodiolus heckerae thiotrophic gill symbiont]
MIKTQVVVIGSGPGGYTAAFRAADLGKQVTLIERYDALGGVCLNVGCIPSKALLHTAQIINEAAEASHLGISFNTPNINIDGVRGNKQNIVTKLTSGIKALAKARKVNVITGYAKFISSNQIAIDGSDEIIEFEHCIIAAGSRVSKIPTFPFDDPRVMDSTDALEIENIPKRLLVVGGGIIGLEMATVYDALGSEITVVELSDQLIASADKDIVNPLFRRIKKQYANIFLNTKVASMTAKNDGIKVGFEGKNAPEFDTFDKVLVAVGRTPNGKLIDGEKAGIKINDWGFIPVDKQMKTNVQNIYAIGDIVGQPMLAHKAVHEAKVAAEVICGYKSGFDALTIPSVAYTDPEVAWTGKTEKQLKAEGTDYEKGVFPWAASGRSLSIGRSEGVSKALFDKKTHRILGMGICGTNAGELIAEPTLAIEMGCDMSDIALTIHAHPTLSETTAFAVEMAEGTITDLLPPKKK